MTARRIVMALVLSAWSAPLGAQSLFNAAGIGLPIEAVDGRARGMGSAGIGLPGTTLLPVDPAASARLLVPGGVMVVQPSWVDLSRDGYAGHRYYRGSRFPLFAAGYPVAGGMASLHATSVLDQSYRGERAVTVNFGGTPVQATDVFDHSGAVSSLSAGYARMLSPSTAVGVSAGRYAGSALRRLIRQFVDSTIVDQALPYAAGGSWSYSGYQVTAGVSSDVASFLRVAASATYSTELNAEPTGATLNDSERSYYLPLQVRVGASSQLAPGVIMAASGTWADWSDTEGDLLGGQAGTATSFGIGVELAQARFFGRTTPVRLGFRRRGLPFALEGESAREQTFAAGFGFAMNETNEIVLAAVDVGVEKGDRTSGSYRENFWRATVSLRISGF
jgi:hypothetical protein